MSSTNKNAGAKHGMKRSRNVDGVNDDEPKSKEAKSSPSTRTAQLSGTTRNMRFMQRGKTTTSNTSLRHSFPPPKSEISAATETTTIKTSEDDAKTRQPDQPVDNAMKVSDMSMPEKANSSNIKWEKATPLDMFGRNICVVIGRRSFNGFNPITASNLHMQQQHLQYEEKLKHRRTTTRDGTTKHISLSSDGQRYKELSKLVQKDERRNTHGKLANRKKKTLDDILKSVDA